MVILCLDAGNTRLKWGLHDGARWCATGALAHQEVAHLAAALPARPRRILACNVAGAAVAAQIESLTAQLRVPLGWFESSAACCGVTNGYERPERLGADRWAALIGAHHLHQGAALVVMAGTATTIDCLDAAGRHRGGVILPGLALMKRALARNTANLPDARGVFRALPTNTDDAIESGCLQATLGAIERMRRHAGDEVLILLSGGDAAALLPHLAPPVRGVENLVLEGLARAATFSSS